MTNFKFKKLMENKISTVSATYVEKNNSWVDGNGGSNLEADMDTNIRILFSESMDTSSITVNTIDTDCSGTIQVSKVDGSDDFFKDGFCLQMSSSPSASNNNKNFLLDPSGNLTSGTTYKIRVTTGVKDGSGNILDCQNSCDNSTNSYQTANGFGAEKY